MIARQIYKKIESAMAGNPAVALMGPRQAGKTTLALNIANALPSIYLDLENPRDLAKVSDMARFHAENREKLIILDEVQRTPEVFAPIRGMIDAERRHGKHAGQFLFLGSASMDLLRQSCGNIASFLDHACTHAGRCSECISIGRKSVCERYNRGPVSGSDGRSATGSPPSTMVFQYRKAAHPFTKGLCPG